MSVQATEVFHIVCDSCKATMDDEEFGGAWTYPTAVGALESASDSIGYADDGWTEDGEGKHHCEKCPPLKLTDAAIAERARKLTAGDVPLAGIDL